MNISPNITRFFGRSLFQLQKHAPTILTTVGVAGVVTAGVLAARATLKLEDTLETASLRLEHTKIGVNTQYSEKTVAMAYSKNVFDLVKLYGPSVTLGAASLVCIVSAHGILRKRNAVLVAAYKGLEETYNRYRARVREEFGEDVDRNFHLGLKDQEITDDKGKKRKIKGLRDDAAYGEYTFIFGPDNVNWVGFPDQNEFFLKSHENVLNDKLRFNGHVFLNEVLDRLGMERTPAGAITGWIYKGEGDSYIDFRMMELPVADTEAFERGQFLLDFNVDGTIWDKIQKK